MTERSKKDDATIQFNKLRRAEDGKKALSEYEAEAAAVAAKTARLKALRLAKEAEEQKAAPPKAASPTKKKSKSVAKKKGGSLSDWLKGEREDGRN
jgi:hypothetical protein